MVCHNNISVKLSYFESVQLDFTDHQSGMETFTRLLVRVSVCNMHSG